jgi:enoyl-CoA hydratase/carnithine racemase
MELLLTGETFDAAAALRIGLVSRVVPKHALMASALSTAEQIAMLDPRAVRAIKTCAIETDGIPIFDAFARSTELSQDVHAHSDAATSFDRQRRMST